MHKGRFGFRCSWYAVMAFLFAILGQPFLVVIWFAFVALAEKDKWAVRQCMEALMLGVLSWFLQSFSAVAGKYLQSFMAWENGVSDLFGLLSPGAQVRRTLSPTALLMGLVSLASLVVMVFGIIALVRVAKGKNANTPLVARWANAAYGLTPQIPPSLGPDGQLQGEAEALRQGQQASAPGQQAPRPGAEQRAPVPGQQPPEKGEQRSGKMETIHNEAKHRFELLDENRQRMGYLIYEDKGPGLIAATHTKMYPAFEGKGYAGLLLDALAKWAEGEGLKIQPACPYVEKMFARYPEKYAPVLPE